MAVRNIDQLRAKGQKKKKKVHLNALRSHFQCLILYILEWENNRLKKLFLIDIFV